MQSANALNNDILVNGIHWKEETFNNEIHNNFELGGKIAKFATNKALLDFYNSAFQIDKIAYAITIIGEKENKYVSGYISMDELISLDEDMNNIIEDDLHYKSYQDKEFNSYIDQNGYFTYYGKKMDKENNEVYSRIFKIMPAMKNNHVMIVIQNALGVMDEKGMVKPTGTRDNFTIPVEYKILRAQVKKIIYHYNAYLNSVYLGSAKINFKN